MLLRSSSTPVINTLLSSFSDSPNRDFDTNNNNNNNNKKHSPFHDHHTTKLSFSHGVHHHLNLTSFSCNSSPSNQESNSFGLKGFRRARSDGNLEGLDIEEFGSLHTQKKSLYKHHRSMLRTEPSFCIYNSVDGVEDEKESGQEGFEREEELKRSVTTGENIEGLGSGEFSFEKKHMGLIEEEMEEEEEVLRGIQSLSVEEEIEPASPHLYLATGLGIDSLGFGGGGGDGIDLNLPNFDVGGDVEVYYKKMLDEYPCHPLLLTNYAQLLQTKGDLHGAEDYYYRATLADPDDGEILSRYAKLIWELHHDQDRALSYFEKAAQAAPQDNHVLAAYASFLWEIDDDGDEDRTPQEHIQIKEKGGLHELDNPAPREGIQPGIRIDVANLTAADANKHGNVEGYYRRMIEENPSNSLVLRNYAQFLCESKGDLEGAEEYYLRAILADPRDGEIISQYAKMVWELHRDHDKALSYFEQAVQATPEDSHVLAAYASFLWEAEEDEEEASARPDQIQMPVLHEGAMTTANA